MKTQLTNIAQTTRERVRTGLVIGGIIVAVIVSLFVAHDVTAKPVVTSVLPALTSMTKHVTHQTTNLNVDGINKVIAILF